MVSVVITVFRGIKKKRFGVGGISFQISAVLLDP